MRTKGRPVSKVSEVADNVTTFRGWLKSQTHRNDPIGDVARDVLADKGCRAATHRGIRERITEVAPDGPAVAAIDQAHAEYVTRLTGDQVPNLADGLKDIGSWLTTLAGAIDRMPQVQRRELIRATRALRSDLHALNIPVPEGWAR